MALFDAPVVKGLGEGNSSANIKKTLEREVLYTVVYTSTVHYTPLSGAGSQGADNLDGL